MSDTTEITCINPRCGRPVTLIKPTSELVHGTNVTFIVFLHGDLQRCAYCGQGYTPFLKDVGALNFYWSAAVPSTDPVVIRKQPSQDANSA